ncbi:MAG: DegT/DnrJ/EryC1/StrS family aminotransferase [Longimicrobiales bacterium]
MPVPLLDLLQQYASIQRDVDSALADVVHSQRFIMGPRVDQLEAEIASLTGAAHAIGCASGTDAILLSLRALELPAGSEVVVPAFTFFATAGAVWNAGLKPVFADIDPLTFNITAETLAPALTDQTRAVVVVHLYGQMAEMQPLMSLAEARGLHVIEDAAQSIRARQKISGTWHEAGTMGSVGCFSFFPSKNLGGFGDGGLITTNDDRLADRLRKLRVHGGRQMYHHEMVGTNSRLDALQAAVLSAKLPHLDGWTERRRHNAVYYDQQLRDLPCLRTPHVLEHNRHVFNQYTIRVPNRDALKARLDAQGIGNAIYYPVPLHLQECFAPLGYGPGDFPESERAAREVISIPVYPELNNQQQSEVVAALTSFAEQEPGED